MNIRLSPSTVAVFNECRLKFKLSQIDRLKPLVKGSIYTVLGSSIHDAIKTYIELKGTDLTTLEGIFGAKLDAGLLALGSSNATARDNLFTAGSAMLKNYIAKDAREKLLPRIVEFERKHEIKRGDYTIVGVIDVIYSDGDKVHIQDYKTSQRVKTVDELADDYQLNSYAWIHWKVYGRVPDLLSLYFIRHDKEVPTVRTLLDVKKFEEYTDFIYAQIMAETEWAPNSKYCFQCDYQHNCPAHTKIRIL